MGITVNTSPQQITASVGETKIDVTVSGGIGPSGAASHTHALADITDAGTAAASDVGDFAAASDFDQGLKTTDSPEFAGLTMASGQVTFSSSGGTFQLAGFSRYIDFETGNIGHSGLAGWVFAGEMDFSSATIIGIDAADVGAAAASHAHSASDVTSGVFDPARIPQFDVLTDTVSSTIYTGRAADGSATSASVWKIRKTVYSSAGAVSSTATATNVKWDDRLTASYS